MNLGSTLTVAVFEDYWYLHHSTNEEPSIEDFINWLNENNYTIEKYSSNLMETTFTIKVKHKEEDSLPIDYADDILEMVDADLNGEYVEGDGPYDIVVEEIDNRLI